MATCQSNYPKTVFLLESCFFNSNNISNRTQAEYLVLKQIITHYQWVKLIICFLDSCVGTLSLHETTCATVQTLFVIY